MKYFSLSIGGSNIQAPDGVPTGGIDQGSAIISLGINLLFIVGAVLAVIFVIYSGIQWTLSSGDKQKLQAARGRLTYAIIGLVVIAASFVIVNIIITLLGGNPKFFLNTP